MTVQGFYDAYGQLSTPGSGYQAPSPMPTRPDESASASQVGQQGSQQSQPAQPTQQQMPHQQSFYNMNPYAAAAYNPYGAYYGFNQFPQQVPPNFSALQGYPYGYGASSPAAAAAPQQLLYQIAAVAAPAPRGHDLQTQDRSAVHHSRTDGFALLI